MSGVCANQASFNQAFSEAVKYNEKKDRPKMWIRLVYLAIYIILLIWALLLAMRVSDITERKEHILFAILFAPIYIISYYLGM